MLCWCSKTTSSKVKSWEENAVLGGLDYTIVGSDQLHLKITVFCRTGLALSLIKRHGPAPIALWPSGNSDVKPASLFMPWPSLDEEVNILSTQEAKIKPRKVKFYSDSVKVAVMQCALVAGLHPHQCCESFTLSPCSSGYPSSWVGHCVCFSSLNQNVHVEWKSPRLVGM